MNTIKKWLVWMNSEGDAEIIKQDVNSHIPINRKLDQIGFYPIDIIRVHDRVYLYVYEQTEQYTKKTKILISRIEQRHDGEKLIDMEDDDHEYVQELIHQLMGVHQHIIH